MNKIMPLDQDRSIDANALNHTAKVQNRFVKPGSIMEKLMDFAHPCPIFAGPTKETYAIDSQTSSC